MDAEPVDRPGRIIFVGGVACVLAATALGSYLAHEKVPIDGGLVWRIIDGPGDPSAEFGQRAKVLSRADNIVALMWMVFWFGAGLTLFGIRRMTLPGSIDPPAPMGKIRDVFGPEIEHPS